MAKRARRFSVNYYNLVEYVYDEKNRLKSNQINIAYILEKLSSFEVKKRLKFINAEKIRLQEIKKISINDSLGDEKSVWMLKFIKFKDGELYGIADDNGSYNEDELDELLKNEDDGEKKYIASPTICIYDEENNVLAIAKNKEGVQQGSIIEFISKVFGIENIYLRAIKKNDKIVDKNILGYKSIEMRIKDLRGIKGNQNKVLKETTPTVYGAIKAAKTFGMNSFNFNGTINDLKGKVLNENASREIFALSELEIENVERLKIKAQIEGQRKFETIDFLEDKLSDQFFITIERGFMIKSDMILKKLIDSYKNNYRSFEFKGDLNERKNDSIYREEVNNDYCTINIDNILSI